MGTSHADDVYERIVLPGGGEVRRGHDALDQGEKAARHRARHGEWHHCRQRLSPARALRLGSISSTRVVPPVRIACWKVAQPDWSRCRPECVNRGYVVAAVITAVTTWASSIILNTDTRRHMSYLLRKVEIGFVLPY